MSPHVLDRVEFRRVSRKTFHDDALSGRGDVILDQEAAMDGCAIPQDQNLAGDVPLQMTEKRDDLGAFNASLMNLKIESPQRQPTNDGKTFPVEGLVQHRRLSARGPGADARRAGAQPAFVDENDGSALPESLFFKSGHSTRCQRRMAFSSRSTARRSGLWQLKPLAPIKRQT